MKRNIRARALALLLLLALASVGIAGCNGRGPEELPARTGSDGTSGETGTQAPQDPPAPEMTAYALNSNTPGIRILGERFLPSERQINCDWTCSGIEMNVEASGGNMIFTARVSAPFNASCYFRAYVDGEPWKNTDGSVYFPVSTAFTPVVLQNLPAGTHTVRLIKVTGYTLARAELTEVKFAGRILEPAPDAQALYVEFIGDSICCGWGTIGGYAGEWTDQDGTLAYPYLVASALGADWSITALSGQGLLKGTPGTLAGYQYASPLRSTGEVWSFSRKADITVINIGTNDASLNQPKEFRERYEQLLRQISAENPGGKIICIYNTMNDNYSDVILALCADAGGEAAGIYTLRFDRAPCDEGHPTNHPSAQEHEKEAEALLAFLRETMENPVTAIPFAPRESGGLTVQDCGTGILLRWGETP